MLKQTYGFNHQAVEFIFYAQEGICLNYEHKAKIYMNCNLFQAGIFSAGIIIGEIMTNKIPNADLLQQFELAAISAAAEKANDESVNELIDYFLFNYDKKISEQMKQQWVKHFKETNKLVADAIAQMTTETILSVYRNGASGWGLNANDMGDALAVFWLQSWQAIHNSADPTIKQASGVSKQIKVLLGLQKKNLNLDESKRQEVAESYIYQAVMIASGFRNAQREGNEVGLKRIAKDTRHNLIGSGIDISSMQLTDEGFKLAPQDQPSQVVS